MKHKLKRYERSETKPGRKHYDETIDATTRRDKNNATQEETRKTIFDATKISDATKCDCRLRSISDTITEKAYVEETEETFYSATRGRQ